VAATAADFSRGKAQGVAQHRSAKNLPRPFGLRSKFRHPLLQRLPRVYPWLRTAPSLTKF